MQPKDGVPPPRCYIATSDRNIQSISGGRGAVVMSSTLFIQELKAAKREAELAVCDAQKGAMAGSMVEDMIGADQADKLYALMEQLEGRQIRPRAPSLSSNGQGEEEAERGQQTQRGQER